MVRVTAVYALRGSPGTQSGLVLAGALPTSFTSHSTYDGFMTVVLIFETALDIAVRIDLRHRAGLARSKEDPFSLNSSISGLSGPEE